MTELKLDVAVNAGGVARMVKALEESGRPEAANLAQIADKVTEVMKPELKGTPMVIVLQDKKTSTHAISFFLTDEQDKPLAVNDGMMVAMRMVRQAADSLGQEVHGGALAPGARNKLYEQAVEACDFAREAQANNPEAQNFCRCPNCQIATALGLIMGGAKMLGELGVGNIDLIQFVHLAKELCRIAEVSVVQKSAIGSA